MLSGAFAGPVLATAKCLFSLICTFLSDWTSPLLYDDLRSQYLDFLSAIACRYDELQPWPHLIIPNGYTAVSLHMYGDGSAQLASATLYLISARLSSDELTAWSPSNAFSILVDSVAKVKHHSVPVLEAIGMLEGTTLTAAFLADNWAHLSSHFPLTLNIGCDSTCTLYTLK